MKVVALLLLFYCCRLIVDYWSRHSKVGAPIPYEILCKAKSNFGPGASTITLDLEKRGDAIPDWPYYQYQPLGNVETFSADLVSDGPFQTSGTFTPDTSIGPGSYRFKLTVTRPDNGTETRYRNFYYSTSDVTLTVDNARDTSGNQPDHLTVNGVYTVEAMVHNSQFCDIEQGTLTLSLLSDSGVQVFRKEVAGIHLPKNTTRTVAEIFTFVPPVPGHYYFRTQYSDETGKPLTAQGVKLYKTGIHLCIAWEKGSYALGETSPGQAYPNRDHGGLFSRNYLVS